MIKTKDGYVKLIGTKYTGDQYSLLKSDGNVWEVNKSINNEADKIVRTDSSGVLPLDKITVKSEIQLSDKTANIYRIGYSGTINKGRDRALLKTTTYQSNSTLYSIKTTSGSWDMAVNSNKLNLHYISDSYYNEGTGDYYTLTFPEKTGTLALKSDVPVLNILTGASKGVVSSSIKDPFIILTSKVEDITKNLGQIKIQGIGSTIINSNTTNTVIISSTVYKAGTGLQENLIEANSINGYNTNTISVKLGYETNGDKYAVQAHTSGLFVQVPWRTIKIKGQSINRDFLDFIEGDNIKLTKESEDDSGNKISKLTISAKDTLYEADKGLILTGIKFSVNQGSDSNSERIYGVKVDSNNKLIVKVPWIEYKAGNGIIIKKEDTDTEFTRTISHKDTSTVTENVQFGPTQNVTGSNSSIIKVPYLKVDTYGHIITLGEREYTSKDTTYTFEDGINCFYVIPLNGTKKQVNVTPVTESLKFKANTTEVCNYTGDVAKTVTIKVQNNLAISGTDSGTITIDGTHGHKYAGSTTDGGPANSVAKSLTLKINSGTTENTDLYTFDGSVARTLNITEGDNVSIKTATNRITISAIDTKYTASDGIKLDETVFKHINAITPKNSYASTNTTASAAGGKIKLTDIKYDAQGHIIESTDREITLSQDHYKNTVSKTNGTNTSGKTINIPYITVNTNGHVTNIGSITHTVSGFLTEDQYKGTVTSITPGTGLTGTSSDTAITTSGTINLKTATTSEIGGIKIGYSTSGKNYAVQLSSDKAYVNVPWTDTKYSNGTGLNLSILNVFSLKTASSSEIGGIRVGYTTNGKKYKVQLDSDNNAYVNVPWENDTHYTSYLYAGNSTASSNQDANNPYLVLRENNTKRSGIQFVGKGNVSISSSSGVITIEGSSDSLPPTGSVCNPVYIDDDGIPVQCTYKNHGQVDFTSGSSGSIYCYQFGPIIVLQGYITKLDLDKTSYSNPVFTLPTNCPSPQETIGFPLIQKNGYANDRNTLIIIQSKKAYCSSNYSDFNPDGTYYYISVCYMSYGY